MLMFWCNPNWSKRVTLFIFAKYLPTPRQSYDRVIYYLNFYHSSKSSLANILNGAPGSLFRILWKEFWNFYGLFTLATFRGERVMVFNRKNIFYGHSLPPHWPNNIFFSSVSLVLFWNSKKMSIQEEFCQAYFYHHRHRQSHCLCHCHHHYHHHGHHYDCHHHCQSTSITTINIIVMVINQSSSSLSSSHYHYHC